MMHVFIEILNLTAIKTLLVAIPESVGLLIFGIGLVVAAVMIRRLLGHGKEEKADETYGKKV